MNPADLYQQLIEVNERARRPGRTPELVLLLAELAIQWARLPRAVRASVEVSHAL